MTTSGPYDTLGNRKEDEEKGCVCVYGGGVNIVKIHAFVKLSQNKIFFLIKRELAVKFNF